MSKDDKKAGLEKAKYKPQSDDATPVGGHKKNTKRWCKGKVGREHVLEIVKDHNLWFTKAKCVPTRFLGCHHIEQCTVCGKVLRRWLPPKECPDYA